LSLQKPISRKFISAYKGLKRLVAFVIKAARFYEYKEKKMTFSLGAAAQGLSMRSLRIKGFFLFMLVFLGSTSLSQAVTERTLFGPERFERSQGAPTLFSRTFGRCNASALASVQIQNGDRKKTRISSAEIYLNGAKIFGESDFNKNVNFLQKEVGVLEVNNLSVELKSGRHDEDEEFQKYLTERRNLEQELERLISNGDSNTDHHDDDRISDHDNDDDDSGHDNDDRSSDHDDDDHDGQTQNRRREELLAELAALNQKIQLLQGRSASFMIVEIIGEGCDLTPPVISALQPADGDLVATAQPHIQAHYADEAGGSGIDPAGVRLILDGADVTAFARVSAGSIDYFPVSGLAEGVHSVELSVVDLAGNGSGQSWRFTTDSIAPRATVTSHTDGAWLSTPIITLSGSLDDATANLRVNGVSALNGISLSEGANSIEVVATDPAGNSSSQSVTLQLDTVAPVVTITAPVAGLLTNLDRVAVAARVDEPILSAAIDAQSALIDGQTLSLAERPLTEGENRIAVTVSDRAGNPGSAEILITRDSTRPQPPVFDPVASPTNQSSMLLQGNTEPFALVEIRRQAAASVETLGVVPVDESGRFQLADILLTEGANLLSARATDAVGNRSADSAELKVMLDTVPPVITISTPQDGLLTAEATVALSGSVDEPLQSLTLNALPLDLAELGFAEAAVPLVKGENSLVLVAVDRAGNQNRASIQVRRDSRSPDTPQLHPPASPTNQAATTLSGSAEPGCSVVLSVQRPDGSNEELAILSVADDGSFSLAAVVLVEGENTFSAVATDAAGNPSEPSSAILVERDSIAPVISIRSPLDGSVSDLLDIVVSGSVDETDAVLTIDGVDVPLDGGAFNHSLSLQPGSNTLILLATDPAGNSGSASLIVQADGTPPTITIASPAPGSLTSQASATLVGSVDEEIVALTLNGQSVPFAGRNFSIPAALAEGENLLTLAATDPAGNIGSAAITLLRDSRPPELQLTGPTEADAGSGIALQLHVSDVSALNLVELRSATQLVWSGGGEGGNSLDQSLSFSLSPELVAGHVVTLRAAAIDAAGNRGEASLSLSIARGASGPGYLQGEVYDDSRGLLLAAAEVQVLQDGIEILSALSAADGGYFFELPAGAYLLRMSKPGFTLVERPVRVQPSLNLEVRDARLTPQSGAPQRLDLSGGTLTRALGSAKNAPTLELDVPADLLTDAVDLRLLPLSNQGLPGVLPLGWAPLAACHLQAYLPDTTEPDPAALSALGGSTLRIPLPQTLALEAGARLLLAAYDNGNHLWRAAGSVALNADQTMAQAILPGGGSFALLLADSTASAPPAADLGQPLPGSAVVAFEPAAVTVTGRVVPYAAPPRQGLLAAGEVCLAENMPGELLSGTLLIGKVVEQFDLYSGEILQPAEYRQDLTFYRAPCITNIGNGVLDANAAALRTSFPVSPSQEFTVVDLLQGKVGIEIRPPETNGSGVLVGPDGARLVDNNGNVLDIPTGALAASMPVQTRTLSSEVVPGADFVLLRAVEIDLTGQRLATSATLSIPAPTGLDPALPLLLVRQIEVAGLAKLKLVGSAKLSGSLVVSDTQLQTGAGPLSLPGILGSGRYALLQARAPLAYLRGTVSGSAGSPFAGALVSSDTNSLVDLTGVDGSYLIPLAVAPFTAIALDPARQDFGSATGEATAAAQLLALDLRIQPVPPQVVIVTPADGVGNVEPNVAPCITFSEPLDRTSVAGATLQLRDSSGQAVAGTLSFNPDSTEVTFYPAARLVSEATYTLSVAATIRDRQNYPLGQPHTSSFSVRDTTPPPMPPAGSISATFPDADGLINVSGTQGSVELGATVLVINDTSGEIVGVSPESNGSFTAQINAQLGDQIQVVMMDAAGNQTLISYLTFKSDDGRYLVTARGGKVEGADAADGLQLDIPDGALFGPAVVKITPVAESELPHPVPDEAVFLGAVNLDTGGLPFRTEVKLSIPAPADLPEGATFFVARHKLHVNADGSEEEVYEIIDSAKLQDGRITTASPPFAGIYGFGIFSFLMAKPAIGPVIISGTTYRDMDGNPGYLAGVDRPIEGAVIRSPGAWNFIAYSNSQGHYAAYGFTAAGVCRNFAVTAIHPLTMFRHTANITTCDAPYIVHNLNFKLADAATEVPDITAPEILLSLKVASGQGAQIIAGTVPVGTLLEVPISVIDALISTVKLSVKFKTPLMTTAQHSTMALSRIGYEIFRPEEGEQKPVFRYEYQPTFTDEFAGDPDTTLLLGSAGTYILEVEATDNAGNQQKKRSLDPCH
jgi:hypothetical protein